MKHSKKKQHWHTLNATNGSQQGWLLLDINNIFTPRLSWRQKLNSGSGGKLSVTGHPAASYWPHIPDAYIAICRKRRNVGVCVCVYVGMFSFFFPQSLNSQPLIFILRGQLSHLLPKPDSHPASPAPPNTLALASKLKNIIWLVYGWLLAIYQLPGRWERPLNTTVPLPHKRFWIFPGSEQRYKK